MKPSYTTIKKQRQNNFTTMFDSDYHHGSSLRKRWQAGVQSDGNTSAVNIMSSGRGQHVLTEVGDKLKPWVDKDLEIRKTWSRKFAEYLMEYEWYNPKQEGNTAKPDLRKGWAYYEHVALARIEDKGKTRTSKRLLPGQKDFLLPGEKGYDDEDPDKDKLKSKLYSLDTAESSLNDFGLGVTLYFRTMKLFAMILFVGGLASARNIMYFNSSDYDERDDNFNWMLKGSAICTTTEWVPCEENFCDVDRMKKADVTFASFDNGADGDTTYFVQRLKCPVQDSNDSDILKAGLCNFGTLLIFILFTAAFYHFQSRQEKFLDENYVTAKDYSLRVLNPPKNAYDPEKWREFFNRFDDNGKGVTLVTIVLNNTPLLKALKGRRYFLKELQRRIPDADLENLHKPENLEKLKKQVEEKSEKLEKKRVDGESLAKLLFNCTLRPILRIFCMYMDPQNLFVKVQDKTKVVQKLLEDKYDVSTVFVTFETEKGKRKAMYELMASRLDIKRQNTKGKKHLFGDKKVLLDVIVPTEPSAVRYLNLDKPFVTRICQMIITLAITFGLIILSAFLVRATREKRGAFWAGILTTSLNIIIPVVVKLLQLIEVHPREEDIQRSMYIKITLFRWVNTAITTKFIIPFTSTLGNEQSDLLVAINGILVAEIWIAPLLALLDIKGNLSKHYYAPRATVHEQMLLCFKGTRYNMADKYTDMTKIVFVCYYYCALNPSLLFIGAVSLIVRYYSDKFCLLRIWSSTTALGTQMAEFSRSYFLPLAIVAGTAVSAYDWALYNFDRVCDGEGMSAIVADSPFNVTVFDHLTQNSRNEEISVSSTNFVRVCNEERCCQEVNFSWPPIPSRFESNDFKFMTQNQRFITSITGWLSVVVVVGFFLAAFGHTLWLGFKNLFVGTIDTTEWGKDQRIDMSCLDLFDAYIPQITVPSFSLPLIACNVDQIPLKYLDHDTSMIAYVDEHNMYFDVPFEGMIRSERIKESTRNFDTIADYRSYRIQNDTENNGEPNHVFDIVKYWEYGKK